jgi:uncharacterized NAD(P)/FAD-binding protein YdhS
MPLLRNLVGAGAIRPEANRLGIDIDFRNNVLGRDGRPNDALFVVGVIARDQDWEATAGPELRAQAASIARTIATQIHEPGRSLVANALPANSGKALLTLPSR